MNMPKNTDLSKNGTVFVSRIIDVTGSRIELGVPLNSIGMIGLRFLFPTVCPEEF